MASSILDAVDWLVDPRPQEDKKLGRTMAELRPGSTLRLSTAK
jgi:hypothetical protein